MQLLRETWLQEYWVQTGLQGATLLSLILAKKHEQAFLLMPPYSVHCLHANPVTNTSYSVLRLPQEMRKINKHICFQCVNRVLFQKNVSAQCDSLYQVGYISSLTILDHYVSDTTSKSIYYHFPIISLLIFCHRSPSEVSPPLYIFSKRVASGYPMPDIISQCSYTKAFISHLHLCGLKKISLYSSFIEV